MQLRYKIVKLGTQKVTREFTSVSTNLLPRTTPKVTPILNGSESIARDNVPMFDKTSIPRKSTMKTRETDKVLTQGFLTALLL